jgi:hypothetical protein
MSDQNPYIEAGQTTQWPKEEQTIQWPKEEQTTQWPKEEQTTQWPNSDLQSIHIKLKIEYMSYI